MKMYDLIIIGAGPSGLGASIYASRYKLSHIVLGEEIGGQIVKAGKIENWPGEESISGIDLMKKFRKQAEDLGGKIVQAGIDNIEKTESGFKILTEAGETYESLTIIFALGMKPRKMDFPREDDFVGKGISYCATCDAMFFRGKDVVVLGGGDSAATAALHLSEFANSVQLLYQEGTKIFEPAWEEKIMKNEKITVGSFEKIDGVLGEDKIEGIAYETKEGQKKELPIQGVFIEIGSTPGVMLAEELGVELDEQEYIVVKPDQSTNVENVYASGDVTTGSNKFRQVITAVAEGAIASESVYKKVKMIKE
jgi:thioredoxin reductase (NADPH)